MSWLFEPSLPAANLLSSSGGGSSPSFGNIKIWSGAIWTAKPVKFWNGGTWVKANVKYWNGGSWTLTNY